MATTFRQCRLKEILCFTLLLFQLGASTVFLSRAEDGWCRGMLEALVVTCTTTTSDGFLTWRNSSGVGYTFGDTTSVSVGTTGTLGSMTFTLISIKHVSNAVVYTSTASVKNMIEDTTIQCSDGGEPQSINVTVKSPSSPSWAHSPCRFSQNKVHLSWNAPSVAPECCDHYTVQLSNGSVNVTETSVTVQIEQDEAITATVYCVDHDGDIVTKTQEMTINTTVVIDRIMIEQDPCDDNTYHIAWTTNQPSEGVCTPPITMSTITCTTSSTHQSSNNTRSMICLIPATETINATVTITNAAGFSTSQSASTGCGCKTNYQLPPSAVAAIIMGLLALLITVVCVALVVSLVSILRLLPHGMKPQDRVAGVPI